MRMWLKAFFLSGLFVLILTTVSSIGGNYKEIDTKRVMDLMDNGDALVVFPLSPIEFDEKHIKGSVNIVMSRLEQELPEDKTRNIIFYCLGIKCVASWRAAEKAVELGYINAYAYREGIPGWEKAGYPLESTSKLPEIRIEKITTEELAAELSAGDIALLDINLKTDADKFYIDSPSRIHIPLDELKENLNKIPLNKKVVVICLKGKRSPTAVRYLYSKGFKDVVMVEGGMQKWVLEGRPISQSS